MCISHPRRRRVGSRSFFVRATIHNPQGRRDIRRRRGRNWFIERLRVSLTMSRSWGSNHEKWSPHWDPSRSLTLDHFFEVSLITLRWRILRFSSTGSIIKELDTVAFPAKSEVQRLFCILSDKKIKQTKTICVRLSVCLAVRTYVDFLCGHNNFRTS